MLRQVVTRWCVWERPCLVSILLCLTDQHICTASNLQFYKPFYVETLQLLSGSGRK
jgi:hypothetical protein